MTGRFRHEIELPAAPADVLRVLLDPQRHGERYAAAGATDATLVSATTADDGTLTLVSTRVESGSLPGPVARLVRGAAHITQTEVWEPVRPDGVRRATWAVTTRGVPVEIGGTTEVHPSATGTRLLETGAITARLPVVGGLVERVAVEQSGAKLAREWQWLRAVLAGSQA